MSDKTLDERCVEFNALHGSQEYFALGRVMGQQWMLETVPALIRDLQARVKELEARYRFVPIDEAMKEVDEFLGYWNNGDMHVVGFREDGTIYRPMDKEEWSVPDLGMMLPEPPHE